MIFDWFLANPAPKTDTLESLAQRAQSIATNYFELIVVICVMICAIGHLLSIVQKSLWVVLVVVIIAIGVTQILPILPIVTQK
jgi:hypothetical protein